MSDATTDELLEVLAQSQRLGFLGDRPVGEVVDHARAFVGALEGLEGHVADIGSGGGVPGLVVALDRPDLELTLIDRRTKRTDFLRRAVTRLGWVDRVHVVPGDVGDIDTPFDAVIARGFGPPPVTLAAASRLTRVGGLIVISEPPAAMGSRDDRWDERWLASNTVVRSPSLFPSLAIFERVSGGVTGDPGQP